jgi:hypothetical protein
MEEKNMAIKEMKAAKLAASEVAEAIFIAGYHCILYK